MSKENQHKAVLKVYSSDEEAERDQLEAARNRTPTERWDYLMKLIKVAYMLNGGRPFKEIAEGAHIIKVKPRTAWNKN